MTETEIEGDERAETGGEMDAGRVLALSDGVFAIAATLLVLELRVPDGVTDADLPRALHELIPAFAGYTLSYVLIGLLWLGHHRQFRNFSGISARLARINLIFLGAVSVLPFVTSLLTYDVAVAVQLYAATIAVIFLLEAAMGLEARRRGHHRDPAAGRQLAVRASVMASIFLLSIPLAAIPEHGQSIAKYSWLLLVPARIALGRLRRRAERAAAVGAGTQRTTA